MAGRSMVKSQPSSRSPSQQGGGRASTPTQEDTIVVPISKLDNPRALTGNVEACRKCLRMHIARSPNLTKEMSSEQQSIDKFTSRKCVLVNMVMRFVLSPSTYVAATQEKYRIAQIGLKSDQGSLYWYHSVNYDPKIVEEVAYQEVYSITALHWTLELLDVLNKTPFSIGSDGNQYKQVNVQALACFRVERDCYVKDPEGVLVPNNSNPIVTETDGIKQTKVKMHSRWIFPVIKSPPMQQ